jgi:hypothetical protein
MGMDVYGNKPKNVCGKYFGMNMSGWRSLATYACEVAPAITAKCEHWDGNDFDGLNGDDSILLADLLQEEIDSGRTEKYARLWHSERELTLSELKLICRGTGCDTCNGDCSHWQWVKRLQEFVYFLRYCGGFQIG